MNLNPVTPRLNMPEASVESFEELRFWLQCIRSYSYQPLYKTDGRLLAIELLTFVTHPDNPEMRISPDRYFSSLPVRHRMLVIEEQLRLVRSRSAFFQRHDIFVSINVDAPTLLTMRSQPEVVKLVSALPWVRFELVEHINLPKDSASVLASEFGPIWLDDFGTGMSNFSALNAAHYEHIKVARELFTMLRKTPEGRNLFVLLLQLLNRYCQGVIVEGVETIEEWRDVQASSAFAAQGYFLSRPVPFESLENVLINLP